MAAASISPSVMFPLSASIHSALSNSSRRIKFFASSSGQNAPSGRVCIIFKKHVAHIENYIFNHLFLRIKNAADPFEFRQAAAFLFIYLVMKSIPCHPSPQWLAMVQPAQPMRTSLNGRMLFISAVSSFTSASEALDEVRKMRERSASSLWALSSSSIYFFLTSSIFPRYFLATPSLPSFISMHGRMESKLAPSAATVEQRPPFFIYSSLLKPQSSCRSFCSNQRRPSLCPPRSCPHARISQALMTWSAIPELRWRESMT